MCKWPGPPGTPPGRPRKGGSWGEGREEGIGGLWCPWREAVSMGWRPGGRPVRPARLGGSWREEEGRCNMGRRGGLREEGEERE